MHIAFYSLVGFILPARAAPLLWREEKCESSLVHIGHDIISSSISAILAGVSFLT
jgi:hypothetical protein